MSLWLCFGGKHFNNKAKESSILANDSSATNSKRKLRCDFLVERFRFDFESVNRIKQKQISPQYKKIISKMQSSINSICKQRQNSIKYVKHIIKLLPLILLLGCSLGGYSAAVGNGIVMIISVILTSLVLWLICLFVWHYNLNILFNQLDILFINQQQQQQSKVEIFVTWETAQDMASILLLYNESIFIVTDQPTSQGQISKQIQNNQDLITQGDEIIIEMESIPKPETKKQSFVKKDLHAKQLDQDDYDEFNQINDIQSHKSEVVLPTVASESNDTHQDLEELNPQIFKQIVDLNHNSNSQTKQNTISSDPQRNNITTPSQFKKREQQHNGDNDCPINDIGDNDDSLSDSPQSQSSNINQRVDNNHKMNVEIKRSSLLKPQDRRSSQIEKNHNPSKILSIQLEQDDFGNETINLEDEQENEECKKGGVNSVLQSVVQYNPIVNNNVAHKLLQQ